jgi:hypothetical protein
VKSSGAKDWFDNELGVASLVIQASPSPSPQPPTISGASISKVNSKLVTVATAIL